MFASSFAIAFVFIKISYWFETIRCRMGSTALLSHDERWASWNNVELRKMEFACFIGIQKKMNLKIYRSILVLI